MVRIIGGRNKRRNLFVPSGKQIRPTSDRVREGLFNLLEHGIEWHGIPDAHIVDLFCGTGSVGLEALSRGAEFATFVDNAESAITAVRYNTEITGEQTRCEILRYDATHSLPRRMRRADLVYIDPPYRRVSISGVLLNIRSAAWLNQDAVLVVELSRKDSFAIPEPYRIIDRRDYGRTRLLFLQAPT